jgi:hypothetical protein
MVAERVILSAAKNLGLPVCEILRVAQDDNGSGWDTMGGRFLGYAAGRNGAATVPYKCDESCHSEAQPKNLVRSGA